MRENFIFDERNRELRIDYYCRDEEIDVLISKSSKIDLKKVKVINFSRVSMLTTKGVAKLFFHLSDLHEIVWTNYESAPVYRSLADGYIEKGHEEWVPVLLGFSDGRLVSGGDDGKICIWEMRGGVLTLTKSWELAKQIPNNRAKKTNPWIFALVEFKDSIIIGAGGESYSGVYTLALKDGVCKKLFSHQDSVWGIGLLEENILVSCGEDGKLVLYDLNKMEKICERKELSKFTSNVAILKENKENLVVCGGYISNTGIEEGIIRLFKYTERKLDHIRDFIGHTNKIYTIAALPNGDFVSGADDNTIRLWSTTGQRERLSLVENQFVRMVFPLPGGLLASGSESGRFSVWDTVSWRRVNSAKNNLGQIKLAISCFAVLSDGIVISSHPVKDQSKNIGSWNFEKVIQSLSFLKYLRRPQKIEIKNLSIDFLYENEIREKNIFYFNKRFLSAWIRNLNIILSKDKKKMVIKVDERQEDVLLLLLFSLHPDPESIHFCEFQYEDTLKRKLEEIIDVYKKEHKKSQQEQVDFLSYKSQALANLEEKFDVSAMISTLPSLFEKHDYNIFLSFRKLAIIYGASFSMKSNEDGDLRKFSDFICKAFLINSLNVTDLRKHKNKIFNLNKKENSKKWSNRSDFEKFLNENFIEYKDCLIEIFRYVFDLIFSASTAIKNQKFVVVEQNRLLTSSLISIRDVVCRVLIFEPEDEVSKKMLNKVCFIFQLLMDFFLADHRNIENTFEWLGSSEGCSIENNTFLQDFIVIDRLLVKKLDDLFVWNAEEPTLPVPGIMLYGDGEMSKLYNGFFQVCNLITCFFVVYENVLQIFGKLYVLLKTEDSAYVNLQDLFVCVSLVPYMLYLANTYVEQKELKDWCNKNRPNPFSLIDFMHNDLKIIDIRQYELWQNLLVALFKIENRINKKREGAFYQEAERKVKISVLKSQLTFDIVEGFGGINLALSHIQEKLKDKILMYKENFSRSSNLVTSGNLAKLKNGLSVSIKTLNGLEISELRQVFLCFRLKYFSQFPYLYDGEDVDEEEYFETTYLKKQHAMLTLATKFLDAHSYVGLLTGTPLSNSGLDCGDFLREINEKHYKGDIGSAQVAVSDCYYHGEIIVDEEYRGIGVAKELFSSQDTAAKKLGYRFSSFVAIEPKEDHPLKPRGYRFYHTKVFEKLRFFKTDVTVKRSWFTKVEENKSEQQEHTLVFWVRKL